MRNLIYWCCLLMLLVRAAHTAELDIVSVEGQPLAANAKRLLAALELLGTPLDKQSISIIREAIKDHDAEAIQTALDRHVLAAVNINPEARVKVARGPAAARLQQSGYTPVLIKVVNLGGITKALQITSPQAGPVYAGTVESTMKRMGQVPLFQNQNDKHERDRFLDVAMLQQPPMTENLSGLQVEYAIALIYCSESGQREASLAFDVGQGSQDIGFRAETPVLFDVRPAVPVKLSIHDFDGEPTVARLTFHDAAGHVVPPQAKRVNPDFFFQQQIYRRDGDTVLLPPGELDLQFSRGPEYRVQRRKISIDPKENTVLKLELKRWVNPMTYGFYCGDHHIHAAGCAHYTHPAEGARPQDIFLQVKGEGLNVGCVLMWGFCWDYQRQFFGARPNPISEPYTVVKYDLEVSGFGSANMGHICLLNLKQYEYPGSDGIKGWPKWNTPVMRWAKQQGAFTGYAHSASGMEVNPTNAMKRLFTLYDNDKDGALTRDETASGLLPEAFGTIDTDGNGRLSDDEVWASLDRAADVLPNYAIPELNGAGALEFCVTNALGLCDFISAMDTPRTQEWNTWYHALNCGFPLKVSGETDFPCMSSTRVGQGRVYVQLGKIDSVDFVGWCEGIKRGRSYVSDGYAHALGFTVNGQAPGYEDVSLAEPGEVKVKAKVVFAPETPDSIAHGDFVDGEPWRLVGDTVFLRGSRPNQLRKGGARLVELVVNGKAVASQEVPADGGTHELSFNAKIEQSSWVALRQFPQLHTNPVNVLVAGKPIRVSKQSALWFIECVKQLWQNREKMLLPAERPEADATFKQAIEIYAKRAAEAGNGSN